MQKGYEERVTVKYPPCKVPDPCFEYEDYDPCESAEDITEKDLAVLLKEEQAKLKREEDAEAELRRQQKGQQNQQDEQEKGLSGEGKDARGGADGRGAEEEGPCRHRVRKQLCRKLIQNPFFTNRLRFSTDLPPPPPMPPPQFFPLVDESDSKTKICPKKRKKCKKRKEWGQVGDEDGSGKEGAVGMGTDDGLGVKPEEPEECACMYEDECLEKGNALCNPEKGKRKCKKPVKFFNCKKKESEVSISLLPRQIPALQRDLPPTSPKDIPEVERQILMACGKDCEPECKKKKKCKKKSDKTIDNET